MNEIKGMLLYCLAHIVLVIAMLFFAVTGNIFLTNIIFIVAFIYEVIGLLYYLEIIGGDK